MFQSSGTEELWGFRCSASTPIINYASCCEYQLQARTVCINSSAVSLAPASSTEPTEEMRKDRSPQKRPRLMQSVRRGRLEAAL